MGSRVVAALLLLLLSLVAVPVNAQPWRDDPVRIVTLSNRGDLISGGDALVEVVLPDHADAAQVTVGVDGRNVTSAFAVRGDGRFYGRIDGLAVGGNRVTATLPDGSGAYLDITNHPIGGPVFSGPQIQPWICTTEDAGLGAARDEQCNAAPAYAFLYMSQSTGVFMPYDPEAPPPDAEIASTTTDEGETVPFIIREETGTQNRGVYKIAVLFDPNAEWTPWAAQPAWNHKLFYPFLGGCSTTHSQNTPSDVQYDAAASAVRTTPWPALGRGFMVASSSLNRAGASCNSVVSAETVMMLQEHIVERYGEMRYTISAGGSGGSFSST